MFYSRLEKQACFTVNHLFDKYDSHFKLPDFDENLDESERIQNPLLREALKMSFGRKSKIDDTASIVDYLYHYPVKANILKNHR